MTKKKKKGKNGKKKAKPSNRPEKKGEKKSVRVKKPAEARGGEEKGLLEKITSFLGAIASKLNPLVGWRGVPRARPKFTAESLTGRIRGEEIDQYPIGQAQVYISMDKGTGYYEVTEPSLDEREREVYEDLLENFYDVLSPEAASAENPMKYVEGAIWKSADELGLLDEVREGYAKYRYFIERDGLGYGKLQVLMEDPEIEEITVTGPKVPVKILHRRYTEHNWLTTNVAFKSEEELKRYAQKLAQRLGESLTAAAPITDATTRQGDRVSLTFGDEVTHPGTTLTIRKPVRNPLSLAKLIENGTLSAEMAAYLWQVLEWGGFPQVIGAIASGKTTLLNAILATVSPNKKMTTLEDTLELNLPHENWHRFHTRLRRFGKGEEYEVDLLELVKLVMRHRPDYLAVGEVRGKEIGALTHVASLGHSAACTLHAETPEKALTRMRHDPMNLTLEEILLVWCLPLTRRLWRPTGGAVRRVWSIHELTRSEDEEVKLNELFSYDSSTDSFKPNNLEKIVEKSTRLREAGDARGLSQDEIVRVIERKKKFLKKLVEKKKLSFEEYTEGVRKFYEGEAG